MAVPWQFTHVSFSKKELGGKLEGKLEGGILLTESHPRSPKYIVCQGFGHKVQDLSTLWTPKSKFCLELGHKSVIPLK